MESITYRPWARRIHIHVVAKEDPYTCMHWCIKFMYTFISWRITTLGKEDSNTYPGQVGFMPIYIPTYLPKLGRGGFLHIQTFSKRIHTHETRKIHTHTQNTYTTICTYYTYTSVNAIHTHTGKIGTQTYLGQGWFGGERRRTVCCMSREGRGSFLLVWGRRLRTVRHRHHRHRGHHHHHRQKKRGGGSSLYYFCSFPCLQLISCFFNICYVYYLF